MKNIHISSLEEESDISDFDKPLNIDHIEFINITENKHFFIRKYVKNILIDQKDFKKIMDPIAFINQTKRTIDLLERTNIFNSIILKKTKNDLFFLLNPKSSHFQSFSQNFGSSGKIGFSYEIGLRNIFKSLELLTFKYEKNIGGGNLVDFALDFPIFPFRNQILNFKLSSCFGDEMIYENIYNNKKNFSFNFLNEKNSNNWTLKFQQRRFLFSPLIFENYNYEDHLENDISADLIFSQKNIISDEENFCHFFSTAPKIIFSHSLTNQKTDIILNYDIANKFFLRKILPLNIFKENFKFYKMEIESYLNFNTVYQMNSKKNFALFNKKYFSRLRGFENIDSNIPFKPRTSKTNSVNNFCLSLLHSLKFNLLFFPQIENQQIFPFFHLTNIMVYDKQNSLKHYLSSGIGMEFKMSEHAGLEVLFNFFHLYNKNINSKTKEENIQIRISLGD